MKHYSVVLMRRERIPALFPIVLCAALSLTFAAIFGAFFLRGKAASLIPEGVFLILFLFLTGLYLFSTDEKRLLRKTLFGKTLLLYAQEEAGRDAEQAAKALMEEIDGEAEHMLYECAGFALTAHWIILFERPRAVKFFPGMLTALPVPRRRVRKISLNAIRGEENGALLVRLWTEGNAQPHGIRTFDPKAAEALRQWGEELRERREV